MAVRRHDPDGRIAPTICATLERVEWSDGERDHFRRERLRRRKLDALHSGGFFGLAGGFRIRERLLVAFDANREFPRRFESRLVKARKRMTGAVRRERRKDVPVVLKQQTVWSDDGFVGERGLVPQSE